MENAASSTKAQSKAPTTPGQALTFRAAPSSESRRDVNRRHEGKQTIHDGFGPGTNRAKQSPPVFRTPGLLDGSSPAWYQEGDVLPPDAEAESQDPEDDPPQDSGKNRLPTAVPRPPSPLQWGRLDYRTQAVVMKSLTKFYKKKLFALDTACDALHLYRHEADEFVARHLSEYSKVISGEIDDTTLLDRGTVYMARRFMTGQGLPHRAIDIAMQMSSQIIRWPLSITTDGPPAPADPFISAGFPSFVPLPSWTPPVPTSSLNQGRRPQPNPLPPQPRYAGFLQFAFIPGMEGIPHGVRFTEIVLPPKTLVRGPHSAYTLQDGGRYVIQYPDWCKNHTNMQLSHFTFVEGHRGAKPIPQQAHGGYAAHSDDCAQKHDSSPFPVHKRTEIPTDNSSRVLKSHGSNTVHRGWEEGDSELVTPNDLQWDSSIPMPPFYEEEQGIPSEELARMPAGSVAPTCSSIISQHVSHEPYLTIRLPSQYYVFGPRSQLITFDGNFGIRSAPACQLVNPKQPCRHGNLPHSVGGVYSFWFSQEVDPQLTQANLAVLPRLPEAVFARFLLPSRYAMYRDGSLMPRVTEPGFHELRRMRKTQRIDGAVAEEKTTMDLVDQNGIYMLLNNMVPYRSRVLPVSQKGADASSDTDEPPSEDEEQDEGIDDIAAIKSMPQHMQDTMLEAHRLILPYRKEFEAEMEEERRQELLAEKREYSREKALALKEAKEEKKRKTLQRSCAASRNVAPVTSYPPDSSGQHGGPSRTGTGLGMGLISFNDEVLKRQIESSGSSSSSSDGERTQRKRRKMEKLAEKLDRIPDDDDDEDETFHTSRWGRKITKSTKAQEQQQAPVTRRTAPRAASSAATTTKQAQAPTPASTGRQTAVATPPTQPGPVSGDSSPLKKKRGRPRKHPLPEPVQPEAGSSTAGATNTESSTEASASTTADTIHCAPNSSLSVRAGQQSRVESGEQASADSGNNT